jgi:transposase
MSGLEGYTREELVGIIVDSSRVIEELRGQVASLQETVALLLAEVERLKGPLPGGKAPPPAWVKASVAPVEKTERKKRSQSFVRTRQEPTDARIHACENCPDCGRRLSGGWVHRSREVIEIPQTPVAVTEHRVLARYCGVCNKRCLPTLDLSQEVLGKHRVGVRLMSLIGWLSAVGRLPVRRIQAFLLASYRVHLSVGEITEALHAVAAAGKPAYEAFGAAVRESGYVHADETGWREGGVNGYVWSFVTPTVRYFLHDKSRAHEVPERVLGEGYEGVLVSDFYSGYHFHLGLHQRCWVHFLRDLQGLKEQHPEDASVTAYVDGVVTLYRKAKAFVEERAREPANRYREKRERAEARAAFQGEAMALARPFLNQNVPQRVLAQRIERFLPELFTFVEHGEVPSENNAAERAIRPCVIARKVCGGTRSKKGSNTKMTLLSLFGSWQAQGKDLLHTCQTMLAHPTPTNTA